MRKSNYYNPDNILAKNAQYNLIIGERSNGKTYAIESIILQNYVKTGKQGAIIRRWREDFKSKRGAHMFDSLISNGVVEKLTKGKYDGVIFVSSAWYLAKYDSENKSYTKEENPFCFSFSLSEMEHDKSVSYPNVTTILFDEFITRGYYIQDEFVVFMNTLSTIIRDRNDVKIFMCGNTVNKYCPYFSEFGLTHITKMKQGDIDVYSYGESKLKLAVEYCSTISGNRITKKSDIYFAFNNPKLEMIKHGTWEIDIYPHLPHKYKPSDIMFLFFIVFNNEIVQCEVVQDNTGIFVFLHKKTTELKENSTDLIYNLQSNVEYNKRFSFIRPVDRIDEKILYLYKANRFFYQSNDIGEIVNNFIKNSKGG